MFEEFPERKTGEHSVASMVNRNDYNRQVIEEFRAGRGKPGWRWEGRHLLLLTTTGARSGLPRTTPMMYIPDGDRLLVIASNIGAPAHPDWFRNLVAQSLPSTNVVVTGRLGANSDRHSHTARRCSSRIGIRCAASRWNFHPCHARSFSGPIKWAERWTGPLPTIRYAPLPSRHS